LRFLLPLDRLWAGSIPVMVSLSNRARLASGAFYEAAPDLTLYQLSMRTSYFPASLIRARLPLRLLR
jgi:hypothetical protein